jgi:hypothetical protein
MEMFNGMKDLPRDMDETEDISLNCAYLLEAMLDGLVMPWYCPHGETTWGLAAVIVEPQFSVERIFYVSSEVMRDAEKDTVGPSC